ncbi:MAG: DUF5060 domain-containing protein [Planctomycetota bacterium]
MQSPLLVDFAFAAAAVLSVQAATVQSAVAQSVTVDSPDGLRRWHALALVLEGPQADEQASPNPFLDLRMDVTFAHAASGTSYLVPGHFAADGDAANSSATAGNRWRAFLSPDHVGTWTWYISFRSGTQVAIDSSPAAGTALAPYDGLSGSFDVVETDKVGRDHRARGRLRYVDEHYLRYADGTWFLKAGADSPENLLAYDDIDNTPNRGNRRKSWSPHAGDWAPGDPEWQNGSGRELIGALNYLAAKGVNAFSFLTYNHNGDDKNVFPYVDPDDRLRLDCSKVDQWDIVLTHGDKLGHYLHFKTQETENDQDMDGGALGVERKLYYRELVSRFAHHLALNWNLGEENTNTGAQRIAFAQWIADLDPYDHQIVLHTYPGQQNSVYTPMLGSSSALTGVSLQTNASNVFQSTLTWRTQSANAGKPWVCANDEQGNAQTGIVPDQDDPQHDSARSDVLWGNLMAGGAGIECYFGYAYAHSDLTCEDFRSRDLWWDQCRHALRFFGDYRVPFQEMANEDALVSAGHCLAGGDQWVVYVENAASAVTLDLSSAAAGSYEVWWYDPRQGGALQSGSVAAVAGGANAASLGAAPGSPSSDWVMLVRPAGFAAATVNSYGASCGAGVPAEESVLAADGLPTLGNMDWGLRAFSPAAASGSAGGSGGAPSALLAGFGAPVQLPVSGCTVLVAVDVAVLGTTDAGGVARYDVPVPVSISLLGSGLTFQGLVAQAAGPFLGVATTTAGIEIRMGR